MRLVTSYIVENHDKDGMVQVSLTTCFGCAVKAVMAGVMDTVKPRVDFECDVYSCRMCDVCHNFID